MHLFADGPRNALLQLQAHCDVDAQCEQLVNVVKVSSIDDRSQFHTPSVQR